MSQQFIDFDCIDMNRPQAINWPTHFLDGLKNDVHIIATIWRRLSIMGKYYNICTL